MTQYAAAAVLISPKENEAAPVESAANANHPQNLLRTP